MKYSLKALEDKGKKNDYCKHKVIRERNEVYDMFDINCNFFLLCLVIIFRISKH